MEFLSEENIRMLCEIHENPPLSFEMMKNYASLFISQHNNIDNLLLLNKNFLIHLHLHYQANRNVVSKTQTYNTELEYVNEYDPPIPPTPNFSLSTNQDSVLTDGPLNVLIQNKLKEREDELLTIQSQFNSSEESPESVKLIKISDVISDLSFLETDYEIDNSKKKISIGNTTIFEYNENEPPSKTTNIYDTIKESVKRMNRLNEIHTEYLSTLNKLIEGLSGIDKLI